MKIGSVEVTIHGGEMSEPEVQEYITYIHLNNEGRDLQSLDLTIDGEYVDMRYTLKPMPFERIRRITGYLVGSTERWNNAKRAEEHDRVKHG